MRINFLLNSKLEFPEIVGSGFVFLCRVGSDPAEKSKLMNSDKYPIFSLGALVVCGPNRVVVDEKLTPASGCVYTEKEVYAQLLCVNTQS